MADLTLIQFVVGSALLGASMTLFVQGVYHYRSEH